MAFAKSSNRFKDRDSEFFWSFVVTGALAGFTIIA